MKKTKIIVFSDSHGEASDMRYVIDALHPDAEYILHLGDGAEEFERMSAKYPRKAFLGVSGNCDIRYGGSDAPIQRTADIDGIRIFMCHGHRHGVSGGDLSALTVMAKTNSARIALFGHTHYSEYMVRNVNDGEESALHIMNPGSITRPRGGEIKGKSYGLIETDENGEFKLTLCGLDQRSY